MRCRGICGGLFLILGAVCNAPAQPAATLGRPKAMSAADSAPAPPTPPSFIQPASFEPEPTPAERIVAASFDPPPFTPPEMSSSRSVPSYSDSDSERFLSARPTSTRDNQYLHTSNFGEKLLEWFKPGHNRSVEPKAWFLSDHEFDYFASPVSNPFLFEDPRSLTEVRPIFIYQSIPGDAPNFQGGNAAFIGTQFRVAFTERFSFVINKLGFVSIRGGDNGNVPGGSGFAELWLGPKFTFLRNKEHCMVAAGGVMFHIPAGPDVVFQDTGRLSIVPYFSFAKNFLDSRFGSLNFMNTTGYSFNGAGERSDYLWSSFNISWDVANKDKFYPLLELHYFQYTFSGTARNLDVEGRDLANIGDVNSGTRANFNMAAGARYKITEKAQVGLAIEFPLNNRKDINQFRLTVDFIWRY